MMDEPGEQKKTKLLLLSDHLEGTIQTSYISYHQNKLLCTPEGVTPALGTHTELSTASIAEAAP